MKQFFNLCSTFNFSNVILIFGIAGFGCSKQAFQFDSESANQAIASHSLMGDNNVLSGKKSSENKEGTAQQVPPSSSGGEQATMIDLPVKYLCSTNTSTKMGYNLLSASEELELVVTKAVDGVDKELCRVRSKEIRKALLNNKKLIMPGCDISEETLTKSKIKLYDPSFVPKDGNTTIQALYSLASMIANRTTGKVTEVSILYDYNPNVPKNEGRSGKQKKSPLGSSKNIATNGEGEPVPEDKCDKKASPLIVETETSNQPLVLSSPLEGGLFDILGRNSDPTAHSPKQISWLTSTNYKFLVKPNRQGNVSGIDEMFGDNTFGPDGQFSDNGFEALAKYDRNRDQLIDAKDAVFAELALWSDDNLDMIAQPSELITMKEAGVEAISIRYDSRYREEDQYGNVILYKSAVKFSNGQYHLMFDLWFRYL